MGCEMKEKRQQQLINHFCSHGTRGWKEKRRKKIFSGHEVII